MSNNGEDEIKKVAIYMRVSTREQSEEGFSLDAQLKRLRSYCQAREWKISREYVDGGYSGRKTKNRPEYLAMFEDIDQWDGIVVMKMDRIHRNSKNFTKMMEFLWKHDKKFISMSESLDTSTAMGRFVMDIVARINQLESEQIGERVEIGMDQKAQDPDVDDITGTRIPFGYRRVPEPTASDPDKKTIIQVQEEIKRVKKIFQMYLSGSSFRQISLYEKKKYGEKIGKHHSSVQNILHNTFYVGWPRYKIWIKRVSCVVPCVSREDYNKVQDLILGNADIGENRKMNAFKIPDNGEKFYEVPKKDRKFLTSDLRPQPKQLF